jgi:hypothetical protein
VKEWYELCLRKAGVVVVLLVGNKNDLEPTAEKEKVEGWAVEEGEVHAGIGDGRGERGGSLYDFGPTGLEREVPDRT